MRIVRRIGNWPAEARGAVMALGNFDGVHAGHQAVIATAHSIASALGRPCAVMTFNPHPRKYFSPSLPPLALTPFARKAELLAQAGVGWLYVAKFNQQLAETSAEQFVERLLYQGLGVAHVVTGYDFVFGHQRRGNADFLDAKARQLGFGFTRISPVLLQDEGPRCSSTAIREALGAGNMPLARAMLGRPYSIRGRVIHGDKRGRQLGFPTANIRVGAMHLPAFGVYAVQVWGDNAAPLPAVANLGVRPTVDGSKPMLEVHVLSENVGDLYGKKLEIAFIQHLRGEQKFESLDALKAQIAKDVAIARTVWNEGMIA